MTVTGWTIDYIDGMGFPEFVGLAQYWGENPPVHLMLKARWFKDTTPQGHEQEDLEELLAAFGGAGVQVTHASEG